MSRKIHDKELIIIMASLGYLVTVPLDIVLSPIYLVGGVLLLVTLRNFNPWH